MKISEKLNQFVNKIESYLEKNIDDIRSDVHLRISDQVPLASYPLYTKLRALLEEEWRL